MTGPSPSRLPLYHASIDWDAFLADYPPPDVFAETVFKWPAERIRELQNRRFLEIMAFAWQNDFYRQLWGGAGIEPGDIRGLDDITKLPTFNSDDIKENQTRHPPYGTITGLDRREALVHMPLKMQTSIRVLARAFQIDGLAGVGASDDGASSLTDR